MEEQPQKWKLYVNVYRTIVEGKYIYVSELALHDTPIGIYRLGTYFEFVETIFREHDKYPTKANL